MLNFFLQDSIDFIAEIQSLLQDFLALEPLERSIVAKRVDFEHEFFYLVKYSVNNHLFWELLPQIRYVE